MAKAKGKVAKKYAPQLRKSVFQVRYKPRLRYHSLLMPAAEKLDGYPDWQTTGLMVTLRDYEKHRSVTVDHQAITYEQDLGSIDLATDSIRQVIEVLPARFDLEAYTRVGLRRQYVVPVEMEFESLVAIMRVKFFSEDERLRELLPSEITDLLYRVDAKEGDDQYHLTVGPARGSEISQYIAFNRQNHLDPKKSAEEQLAIIGEPPEVGIIIDIDLFRMTEDLPLDAAATLHEEGSEVIERLANEFVAYLLATELTD